MIKSVVKRNGEVVEFDPNKLNKWAEWASESKVSWSEIVMSATKKLSDMCSTKDIHKALIDTCLEKATYQHADVAARLLVGEIYKEVFGDFVEPPSLFEFYTKMVESEKWIDMGYVEEELEEIDSFVIHNKDFGYQYSSLRQMCDKYMLKNKHTGQLFESPQFMYVGIALAAMQNQPQERRVEDVIKLYTYLSDLKINVPTPTLSGMRTKFKGYASCCLFTTHDTAESIEVGSHIAYMMTCASAGIGGYMHTRSVKDPVRGGDIVHYGKLPYLRYYESAVKSTKQAVRGGSATMHINILDPEIEDLIRLKHPTTPTQKQIRGLDYSNSMNKLFIQKVAKNEQWMLISPYYAQDLYDKFYSSDYEGFVELYDKYDKSDIKEKKYVNARELAIDIQKNWRESGRTYKTFIDEINRHTPFKDPIYSSNLCVAPETMVLTDKGYIPIAELEDQEVDVWNGEEFSKTTVRKTGENQKLVKVVTSSGQELECTPYHKFYVFNGYGKNYIEKRAHELKQGDKLCKFDLPVLQGEKDLHKAYQNGFYSGDGCCVKGKSRIYLYDKKKDLERLFCLENKVDQPDQNRIYGYESGLKDKFFVPSSDYSVQSRLDWLAGWLDADGSVYRNGTNEQLIGSSVEFNFLKEVQMMLQTLGVDSKINLCAEEGVRKLPKNDGSGEFGDFYCQTAYRLLINSTDSYKLLTMGLNLHRLNIKTRLPQRSAKQFIKIVDVIDEGRSDDTYCFTEPKRHMGMFNGLLTGQCQEITLPTKGFKSIVVLYGTDGDAGEVALCFIGAIVAGRVTPEEYEDVAYYTTLLIDNTIDLMEYPFPQMEVTAKARRSIGVGIVNLANYLASNNVGYTSKKGKRLIHELAEMHSYYMHKASLRLAKEKGNAEWIGKTKYPEGWLPVDTYNKNVDDVVDSSLVFDWEQLRQDIIEQGGLRNSVLEAHMPGESSSLASNTTNGLYPIRSELIIKSSDINKIPVFVPDYDNLITRYSYEKCWDVQFKDLVNVYAIVQKFCGQAISADFYFDTSKYTDGKIGTKEDLTNLLYMCKMGLKTHYYCNTKSKSDDEVDQITSQESGCASGGCSL